MPKENVEWLKLGAYPDIGTNPSHRVTSIWAKSVSFTGCDGDLRHVDVRPGSGGAIPGELGLSSHG